MRADVQRAASAFIRCFWQATERGLSLTLSAASMPRQEPPRGLSPADARVPRVGEHPLLVSEHEASGRFHDIDDRARVLRCQCSWGRQIRSRTNPAKSARAPHCAAPHRSRRRSLGHWLSSCSGSIGPNASSKPTPSRAASRSPVAIATRTRGLALAELNRAQDSSCSQPSAVSREPRTRARSQHGYGWAVGVVVCTRTTILCRLL